MLFNSIKDQDFIKINNILKDTNYNGCEYSKLYLNAWRFYSSKEIQIAYEEDIIFLRYIPCLDYFDEPPTSKYFYISPLTTIDKIHHAFEILIKSIKEENDTPIIMGVPEEYLNIIKDLNFRVKEDLNYSEYLYSPSDLINLSGKKYHSKRNHIANFDKNYTYQFRPYTQEDRNEVMSLFIKWEEKKGNIFNGEIEFEEEDEYIAIIKELDLIEQEQNAFADVLIVDNKIIGFSLGEITASNTGIVHIEKCDVDYVGSYAKINNLFAKKHFEEARIINRQEDLGIEGLRKSKMSYHPIGFCKKYMLST